MRRWRSSSGSSSRRRSTCARCGCSRGRGVRVPRGQIVLLAPGARAAGDRAALADRVARRRAAERAHGRAHPARRPRRPAAAGRPAQPGAGVLPAPRRPGAARAAPPAARGVPDAAPAARGDARVHARAVRLALCASRSRAPCATTSSTSRQHASFIFAGMLVWWSALEPKRRQLHGDLWKIGHILSARMIGMFLGMAFVLIREPIYTGVYGSGERHGISALADQQTAGAIMVARRHPDHGLRAGVLLLAGRAPVRPRRGGRARGAGRAARGYLTVSLPSMPPARWPGTEQ